MSGGPSASQLSEKQRKQVFGALVVVAVVAVGVLVWSLVRDDKSPAAARDGGGGGGTRSSAASSAPSSSAESSGPMDEGDGDLPVTQEEVSKILDTADAFYGLYFQFDPQVDTVDARVAAISGMCTDNGKAVVVPAIEKMYSPGPGGEPLAITTTIGELETQPALASAEQFIVTVTSDVTWQAAGGNGSTRTPLDITLVNVNGAWLVDNAVARTE